MARTIQTCAPLNPLQLTICRMHGDHHGPEAVPYAQLLAAMEAPAQGLSAERLAAACAPHVCMELWADGLHSFVMVQDISAVLDKLGDAYPLVQHRAILDQFAAPPSSTIEVPSASSVSGAGDFDEEDLVDGDGDHDDERASSSPLVVEVDEHAPADVQALQEELNEAAIAENLIWAALVGQRAKRRRLQRRLGIE